MELDALDRLAADAFPGSVVRKDLAQRFKGQYPVPTYVGEFLLGRYCASTDPAEIAEGLSIVQKQLQDRTVRAGEQELFKSRARERGRVKLIDLVTARLDAASDSYLATLPSLQLKDVRIADTVVREHDRMLTGGFYAEIELQYDAAIALDARGRPFSIGTLRPIQLSQRGILDVVATGRRRFTVEQWRELMLRSVGFEPAALSRRTQDLLLLRMVPFVERNYNLVELGPRGTGKSHLFQQVSPYAHLVSGGKASVAKMFVDNTTGRRGLVAQYDVVCFDEVSGIDFDQKDGVNILKGYMESGEFSRGKESIKAAGGVVMVGNFDVDVSHQLKVGHLFGPFPKQMKDDTAFMDRIHAYVPGWDVPKLDPSLFTGHFGLVSDVVSELWTRLRDESRLSAIEGRVAYGDALSGRDRTAVNKTVSGLLKLLYPDRTMEIATADIAWAVRLALESRRRVKEQQKRIGRTEFGRTDFTYSLDGSDPELVETTELVLQPPSSDASIETPGDDPVGSGAAPGPVWPSVVADDVRRDIEAGESARVEFKETLRWDGKQGIVAKELQRGTTKTVAAFMNRYGGRLIIGVTDKGQVVGLARDYDGLRKKGDAGPDRDRFLQALANAYNEHLGAGATPLIRSELVNIDGVDVCVIDVRPSPRPVYHREANGHEDFFVRLESTTRSLNFTEALDYVKAHWG